MSIDIFTDIAAERKKKYVTDVVKASGMMPLLDAPVGEAEVKHALRGG